MLQKTVLAFLLGVGQSIFDKYHEEITIVAQSRIGKVYQFLFKQKLILILGDKATGKTALLAFLQTGKPYLVVDGEKQIPNPTLGVVLVDEKIQLSKEAEIKWGHISNDIPGDFRDEWRRLIAEINPHGIIYMIDGRLQGDSLKEKVGEIFDDVLVEYRDNTRNLAALHIFVNFSDNWGGIPLKETRKKNEIAEYFEEFRSQPENARLIDLRVMVASTQLSPDKTLWKETEKALEHFAADLS